HAREGNSATPLASIVARGSHARTRVACGAQARYQGSVPTPRGGGRTVRVVVAMRLIDAPAAALGWLGRQGTRAVAVSVFAGILLPPLATLLRPLFTAALIALLCLTFLRVDPAALRRQFARPRVILAGSLWMML